MIAAFKEQLETVNDEEEQQDEELDDVSISSEESDGEEIDEVDEVDADTETMNYEHCENMHNLAFLGYKRTSCFVHTLQLVMPQWVEPRRHTVVCQFICHSVCLSFPCVSAHSSNCNS